MQFRKLTKGSYEMATREALEGGSPLSPIPENIWKSIPKNHIAFWTNIPQIEEPLYPYIPKIPFRIFKSIPYPFK